MDRDFPFCARFEGSPLEFFSFVLGNLGFGVPGIDMGRSTVGEDMDQVLGFGWEMGSFRQERIGRIFASCQLLHQAIEGDRTQTKSAALEHLAARPRCKSRIHLIITHDGCLLSGVVVFGVLGLSR